MVEGMALFWSLICCWNGDDYEMIVHLYIKLIVLDLSILRKLHFTETKIQ